MRHFLCFLTACFLLGGVANAEPDTSRPNIILMMADDMGMGDTSAYQDITGNSDADQVHTPAMERLARMGVRYTDAHTPASRCSPTRYGLLTGRYPWRNRLKHWVLFGVQGDPMIERDRPTLGTLLQQHGYRTAMVGKWHVGLRYRQSDGRPADAWKDADLTQPMFDTPIDHGFDYARFTSRSHGTSGPAFKHKNKTKRNGPEQAVGPGHVHGRDIVGATGNGKELVGDGPNAYVLSKLGGRHLGHAMDFVEDHVRGDVTSSRPFFLYYPSNSNHGPHTPDHAINDVPVAGAAKNVAGDPMNVRSDYIYENDVVLGQLIDYLQSTDDPRSPGDKLINNTIVIFTSDNGAEIKAKTATGPFRSNKGSCYEGGHRVPFLVTWKAGGVGNGDSKTAGRTDATLIGLQDMFATFAEVLDAPLPNLHGGEKGGEDSISVLPAWRGKPIDRNAMFFNDHNESPDDKAVLAMRLDDPVVDGEKLTGKWKAFFSGSLARQGVADPIELYELGSDPKESKDRLGSPELRRLIEHMTTTALEHRVAGGHRLVSASRERTVFDFNGKFRDLRNFTSRAEMRTSMAKTPATLVTSVAVSKSLGQLVTEISVVDRNGEPAGGFDVNDRGLGVKGGDFGQVDDGEAIEIRFNHDIIIESAAIVAGNGVCGGFYQVGDHAPLAIYCVDADIDAKDQQGILSDIGVLKAGQTLRFDSSPHHGVETPGRWRLQTLVVRTLQ